MELCAVLLPLFEQAGIRVIRLGLHAQESVESRRVAGPYHPAFRELVEGRLFLKQLLPALEQAGPGSYQVAVNPRGLSAAVGQKRCNAEALARQGYQVRFVPDSSLSRGSFRLEIK